MYRNDQNPDDLLFFGGWFGDSNKPLYIRISMNRSGFHGMSFLGFERCSPWGWWNPPNLAGRHSAAKKGVGTRWTVCADVKCLSFGTAEYWRQQMINSKCVVIFSDLTWMLCIFWVGNISWPLLVHNEDLVHGCFQRLYFGATKYALHLPKYMTK